VPPAGRGGTFGCDRWRFVVELEHRFELPVGIDKAYPALTDLRLVAECWPGASLDSVDGADGAGSGGSGEFSGSLKIKIGRIPRTFKGTGRFVERDPADHRAVIEATGGATRAGSSATMLVHAKATALTPNRTAVVLLTTLSITGRESGFSRQVMIDVGNESVNRFADAMAQKLAGKAAPEAELVRVLNPDEVAAEVVADEFEEPVQPAAEPTTPLGGLAGGAPRATGRSSAVSARRPSPGSAPVEVLTAAKGPLLQQIAPIVAALVLAVLILRKPKAKPEPKA
jgi:carbon monoxide dehydrogenase subunit G